MVKDYVIKNIRKQTAEKIQVEIALPNNEEATVWIVKDKRALLDKPTGILYVFDDNLAQEIDLEIQRQLVPPEPRRAKDSLK